MRHFLLFRPVTALPLGMPTATRQTVLVAFSSGSQSTPPGSLRTGLIAVAVATIAMTADRHARAASRTQVLSSRGFHRRFWPMGVNGNARFVRHSAGDVTLWLRARR